MSIDTPTILHPDPAAPFSAPEIRGSSWLTVDHAMESLQADAIAKGQQLLASTVELAMALDRLVQASEAALGEVEGCPVCARHYRAQLAIRDLRYSVGLAGIVVERVKVNMVASAQ